jgi:N-acetylglucosamine-6-phosphate deacetylase
MTGSGTQWLCPDTVFDGGRLVHGLALGVLGGRIAEVRAVADVPAGAAQRSIKGLITPGFLDLQVNGGGDVLLNTTPTAAGMARIAATHRRFGTVGIFPTVITDAPAVLAAVAEAALEAKGESGILGLHIEGPHIAVARRGTHAENLVRPLDEATIAIVRRLRDAGIVVMITLAPEAATHRQIAVLAEMGAIVSLGHTGATADEARAALGAGAKCFTHLFNAMSPMLSRAPGVVGAAINSSAYAGFICDGIHVADEMVGLAIRARPMADRMFLVSDAMPTVGGSDRFDLYGQEIRLVDGRLLNLEGSLAGAHVTIAQSVARLVNVVGIDLASALRMAVTVPAQLIGRPDLARIVGRDVADLLVLDAGLAVVGRCSDSGQEP